MNNNVNIVDKVREIKIPRSLNKQTNPTYRINIIDENSTE